MTLGLPVSYFGADINSLMHTSECHFINYSDVDGQIFAFHLGLDILSEKVVFDIIETLGSDLMESEIEFF